MPTLSVNEKLLLAKKLCNETDDFFSMFFQIYPFTKENFYLKSAAIQTLTRQELLNLLMKKIRIWKHKMMMLSK